ncbi:hypothetical protein IFM89_016587 [Coptis chinensis]|uniref:Pentatricopeptide repeat-containing protein n=1 Tax=Coptis chinensis TaxID=261450 RepID=A0A835I2U6_9MAGN|nr:hypothetical protein IFM89_016587 [Coptis chinensis]
MAILELGKQLHAHILLIGLENDLMIHSALINMYCKCGSIQEASRIFDAEENDSVVSWTSMINGYAEHGHCKEAIDLFEKMSRVGMRPDDVTFIGVLACRAHGDIERGRRVSERLLELNPNCAVTYITLCNIYSAKGEWKDAADMRKQMRSKGVVKEPGWSWLKVKDQVSAFVAGDRSHPQGEDIYFMLQFLASRSEMTATAWKSLSIGS